MSLFSNIAKEFQSCIFYKNSNIAKIAFYSIFIIPLIIFLINFSYVMDAMDKNYIFQDPRFFEDIYFFANNYFKIDEIFINEYIFITSLCWLVWFLALFLVENTFRNSINLNNKYINIFITFLRFSFFIILILYCVFIYLDNIEEYNIAKKKHYFDKYINDNVIDYDFLTYLINIKNFDEIAKNLHNLDQEEKTFREQILKNNSNFVFDDAKLKATSLILNQIAKNKYIIKEQPIKWSNTINVNLNNLFEVSSTTPNSVNKWKNEIDTEITYMKRIRSMSFSKQYISIICNSIIFIILIIILFYNKKQK